jgi:hypothetical protein
MWPAGHVTQCVEPRAKANVLSRHAWQPVAPALALCEYVPIGHCKHAAADEAPALAE